MIQQVPLSPLTNRKPYKSNYTDPKPKNEAYENQHISIIIVRSKSEKLYDHIIRNRWKTSTITKQWGKRTRFMIKVAEMSTGTPCNVSLIIRPESTSFTDNASNVYFSGHIHWSHRRTGGISPKWTKNPAKVIWYKAERAERRIAMPPFWNRVPRRKFYDGWFRGVMTKEWLDKKRTNSVIARL